MPNFHLFAAKSVQILHILVGQSFKIKPILQPSDTFFNYANIQIFFSRGAEQLWVSIGKLKGI